MSPSSTCWLARLGLPLLFFLGYASTSEAALGSPGDAGSPVGNHGVRERVRIHTSWRFQRSEMIPDSVVPKNRPDTSDEELYELKPWVMPIANDFIGDTSNYHKPPSDAPSINIQLCIAFLQ